MRIAGLLHDIGRLGLAAAAPAPAGDERVRREARHTEIGACMLEHAGAPDIAAWVLAQGERIDGRGHPRGLVREEIPLESRILAAAEAFELLTAERPHGAGLDVEAACAELQREAGARLDPGVVEALCATVAHSASRAAAAGDRA